MLKPKERDYLEDKLADKLRGDWSTWFRLNVEDPAFLTDFPNLNTGELLATEAVDRAENRGATTTPVWWWLLDLVHSVTAKGVTYDQILTPVSDRILAARDIRAAAQAAGNAVSFFRTKKLFADAPFIDREPCRDKLENLHGREGRTVMVIKGLPKAGKSYSAELIDYVSGVEEIAPFHTILFKLERNALLDTSEFEETITSPLKRIERRRPDKVASEDAFLKSLARWLCGCLADSKEMWWLIFDSFNEKTVSPEAMKLARFMVTAPLSAAGRQYLRVVVIDSPQLAEAVTENNALHPYATEEELKLPVFEESHFREYFDSVDPLRADKRLAKAWKKWADHCEKPDRLIALPGILTAVEALDE